MDIWSVARKFLQCGMGWSRAEVRVEERTDNQICGYSFVAGFAMRASGNVCFVDSVEVGLEFDAVSRP